jgi:hypothetical protein
LESKEGRETMIIDYIIGWFIDNSTEGEAIKEKIKDNYLSNGFIDSFGFLELIASCEEKYGISFSDDDFENDDIFSIQGLAEIIDSKVGG